MTSIALSGTASWADQGAQNPWTGEIRPGVMIGNQGTETDFSLDLFFPVWGDSKRLLFVNPNLRLGDEGSNEQNIGLGYRGIYFQDKAIIGANIFLDTMESTNSNRYNQLGFGLELLTKWVDLRGNYYYPFSSKVNDIGGGSGYHFKTLGIWQDWRVEEAPRGMDGEIGVLIPFISDYVETRAYLGGYLYDSKVDDDIHGVRTRVEVRPIPLINLSAEFRDDNLGSSTFIGGYLDIPFSLEALFSGKSPFEGIKNRTAFGKGARPLRERMTEKVVRDRHIQTFEQGGEKMVRDVIFVNQDNPNQGDGTYENPYHDLASAPGDNRYKDGEWVYVFSWDENPDTYRNVGIRLLTDMVLWGQGYRHPVYNLGGGLNPILDGGAGEPVPTAMIAQNGISSVITLADNNEVMGLTIRNGNHGIYGKDISSTNIHDNTIRSTTVENSGIHIENAFADTSISGKTLSYRIVGNRIEDNPGSGIYLRTEVISPDITGVSIRNTVSDNTIGNNTGAGIQLMSLLLAPMTEEAPAAGIRDSEIINELTGNSIKNNGETGITLLSGIVAGQGEIVDIIGGLVTGGGLRTATVQQATTGSGSITGSKIENTITGNTIEENAANGMILGNALGVIGLGGSGSMTAEVAGSSITNTLNDNSFSSNGTPETG
ncbi:MAG: hypothetical protein HGA78_10500, partial [Nitrospirales bacterium]|nr:hypothetical protein [Nitrospirales bacterium]